MSTNGNGFGFPSVFPYIYQKIQFFYVVYYYYCQYQYQLRRQIFRKTFIQIWKEGSVQNYSPAPYLATLLNCMAWTFYGLPMVHSHSTLLVTINGSGSVIQLAYIILFLIYSDRQKRLRVSLVLILEVFFISILTVFVLTRVHTHKDRSMIVGIISVLFSVMMYASPLAVMVSLLYMTMQIWY